MYCPKCGASTDEEVKFCPQCGEAINSTENNADLDNDLRNSDSSFSNIIKSVFASSQFFALCVIYTVFSVINIFNVFVKGWRNNFFNILLSEEYFQESLAGGGGYNFFGILLSVLILISLWRIHSWAKKSNSKLSNGGLVVLNVVLIIKIIENIIFIVFSPIASIMVLSKIDRCIFHSGFIVRDSDLVVFMLLIAFIVFYLAAEIVQLVFLINVKKSVKNIDNHLKYGKTLIPVSDTVKVTSVIMGAAYIFLAVPIFILFLFSKYINYYIDSIDITVFSAFSDIIIYGCLIAFFFALPRIINLFNNSVKCQD